MSLGGKKRKIKDTKELLIQLNMFNILNLDSIELLERKKKHVYIQDDRALIYVIIFVLVVEYYKCYNKLVIY